MRSVLQMESRWSGKGSVILLLSSFWGGDVRVGKNLKVGKSWWSGLYSSLARLMIRGGCSASKARSSRPHHNATKRHAWVLTVERKNWVRDYLGIYRSTGKKVLAVLALTCLDIGIPVCTEGEKEKQTRGNTHECRGSSHHRTVKKICLQSTEDNREGGTERVWKASRIIHIRRSITESTDFECDLQWQSVFV